jgi:hypothetical protein
MNSRSRAIAFFASGNLPASAPLAAGRRSEQQPQYQRQIVFFAIACLSLEAKFPA